MNLSDPSGLKPWIIDVDGNPIEMPMGKPKVAEDKPNASETTATEPPAEPETSVTPEINLGYYAFDILSRGYSGLEALSLFATSCVLLGLASPSISYNEMLALAYEYIVSQRKDIDLSKDENKHWLTRYEEIEKAKDYNDRKSAYVEFGHLSDIDILIYTYEKTNAQTFDLNAWRFFNEYKLHMHGWFVLQIFYQGPNPTNQLAKIAASVRYADVDEFKKDKRWEVVLLTFLEGVLPI